MWGAERIRTVHQAHKADVPVYPLRLVQRAVACEQRLEHERAGALQHEARAGRGAHGQQPVLAKVHHPARGPGPAGTAGGTAKHGAEFLC